MFISHCFLTDFPPLSPRILKRHFSKCQIWFLFDWSFFFHQQVVFDRRDKITSDLPRLRSYTLRACSRRPLWLLGILTSVWQSDLSTTAAWWVLTQYAGHEQCLSDRQGEKMGRPNVALYISDEKINKTARVHRRNQTNRWVNHSRRWLAPGQEELD